MYEEADTVSVTSTQAMRMSRRDSAKTRKVSVGTADRNLFQGRASLFLVPVVLVRNTDLLHFRHQPSRYIQTTPSAGVDEERLLTLQMENRTLKMEAVERDIKLKQSLARLARAEEAAKRASSLRAPLKGDTNTTRLYAAEQRAAELEDEARELARKLQKEEERGLHYKNMCKEYKVKLDAALKSARMKNAGQRSPTAVFPGQTTSMEDRLKDMLRQERARAAALAEERDELRKAVRASGGKMPKPAAAAAPVSATKDGNEWILEDFVQDGQTYLLDRVAMKVYDKPAPEDWPEPVGRLVDGTLHLAQTEDLFKALDSYLKREQIHLKAAFDRFDDDGNDHLDSNELGKFLDAVMPGVTAAQQRYFCAMCDSNNDGKMTYQELVESMKMCIRIGEKVADRASPEVLDVLKRIRDHIDGPNVLSTVSAVFHRFDADNSGTLENRELLSMVEVLVPDVNLEEKRILLALVTKLDLDGDGKISMTELWKAIRAVKPTITVDDAAAPIAAKPAKKSSARPTPAAKAAEAIKASPPESNQLVIKEHLVKGKTFLLDAKNNNVYEMLLSPEGWLKPLGKILNGVISRPATAADLVATLDGTLKKQKTRLKDMFDKFDTNNDGVLEESELSELLKKLMPGCGAADVGYFLLLLDTNRNTRIEYEELVSCIKENIVASQAFSERANIDVERMLLKVKAAVRNNDGDIRSAFGDVGKLPYAKAFDVLGSLISDASDQDYRFLASFMRQLDQENTGAVGIDELSYALRVLDVVFVGTDGVSPSRPNRHPVAQASEVAALRKQLNEAQARCAELDGALKKEQQLALPMPGSSGHVTNYSASELQSEIKSAWERAGVLQKRYHEAQSALGTMKANHTRVLQQLDDTHKRLNQERKENLKLSAEEKRLAMELEAAREIEPALEQSRRERAALEQENHQLLASAMTAPGESQSEMRKLRSLMAEAQRERADAEVREMELRRTIQTISNSGLEEAAATRNERDRLRMDCSRMEIELEAANEKVGVLMDMSRTALENNAMNNTQVAIVDDGMDEGSLRAELRGLRETFGDQVEELRKAQRLLQLEEQQVDDLRAALTEEKTRADKMNEGLFKKVKAHENELDRRKGKIAALEAQIRRGGTVMEKPKAQTIRTSQETQDVASKTAVDDLANLAPGENVFELRLMSVEVDGAKIGEENPATFMTVDFFEHETQATAVTQGLSVNTDHTLRYIVKPDDFFLEYLDTKRLPVELNKSLGVDFATIGVANLNLSWVLDDALAGRSAESPAEHFCDVIGRSGEVIARLRYAAYMRKSIISDAREYRRKSPVASSAALRKEDCAFSSMISVEISCCRDLVPREGSQEDMVPYLSFQFPGLPSRDTAYGRGADPDFNDVHDLPLRRTPEVEAGMAKSAMEIIAFDDADVDLEGAGVIGIARVDLAPLSKGEAVSGSFPLFSQTRELRGTVFVVVAWKDPDAVTSASAMVGASGAARVSEIMAADPPRISEEMEDDTVLVRAPSPSPMMSVSVSSANAGARASVGASTSSAPSDDAIVVSIGQFELGKTLYHDHKVRQMFMLFEFMPKFHRDDEQQTARVRKESQFVDFGYQNAFPVTDSGLRLALASLLKGNNPEDATIPFCLVSDDNGIDFEDVGFFEMKLSDIFKNGDVVDERVEVLDKNDVPIGRVTVSIVAQRALQSVMLMQ